MIIGLLQKATSAKQANESANIEEQIKLAIVEAQVSKYVNTGKTEIDIIRESIENALNETVTLEQQGKNIKIVVTDRDKTYKYYSSNGTVKELMNPTDIYGWLDTDGTIYLRATKINNNYNKLSNYRMPTYDEIKKGVIEEPIAPSGSLEQMFYPCRNLTKIENNKNLHTEYVTNMKQMFKRCNNLEQIDLSRFDTSLVTDMSEMFYECFNIEELDVSKFDTSLVTSMGTMFYNCNKLTSLNLSSFDTSNVTYIAAMFQNLSNITKLDLSNFDTRKVENIASLFAGTPLQELDLGRNFILKQNLTMNGMEFNTVPNTVKIITTRSIADRIKQIKTSFTESNFQIIE